MDSCQVCNITDIKLACCGKCKASKYCSIDCQRKDWPTHKLICNKIVAELDSTRSEQELDVIIYVLDKDIKSQMHNAEKLVKDIPKEYQHRTSLFKVDPIMTVSKTDIKLKIAWKGDAFVELINLEDCPYSIVVDLNNELHVVSMRSYNKVKREKNVIMTVSDYLAFDIYRAKNDKYYLTGLSYLQF